MQLECMTVDLPKLLRDKDMSRSGLALKLKINKATVTRWAQRGVPPERVDEVAAATGIPAEALRPDLAAMFAPSKQAGEQAA